jgi:uncharacterized membrane protein YphA (DoxX/SURF4 family)
MAVDRTRLGLTILRIAIGVFFVFEGLGKIRWLTNSSILAAQFADWSQIAPTGSIMQGYLQRIAVPGVGIFARLVPLGELLCGTALILGVLTPLAAFLAFFMALNFQIASGAIFKFSFLTSGYGLPVLGSTLALTLAGSQTKRKTFAARPARPSP